MPPKKRKVGTRTVLHTVYAVVEGKNTETEYVDFLKRSLPKANGLKIVAEHPQSSRKHLYQRAREIIKQTDEDTEVWILCDVDDAGPELVDLSQRTFAGDERLHWAISNPQFAVWLVMHFNACTRSESRHVFGQQAVKLGVAVGAKGKSIDTSKLEGLLEQAHRHAGQARKTHEGVTKFPENNPQSDVDRFIDRIIELHNKYRTAEIEEVTTRNLY